MRKRLIVGDAGLLRKLERLTLGRSGLARTARTAEDRPSFRSGAAAPFPGAGHGDRPGVQDLHEGRVAAS